MKFTVTSTTLNKCLSTLGKVLANKNGIQILDYILFEINNGKLTMTASDAENTMKKSVYLDQSEGEGKFCVQYTNIQNSVKDLPEQPIEINVNMETYMIDVVSQNGKYSYVGQNADEYPTFLEVTGEAKEFEIDEKTLNENITRASFAMAQDMMRPVMSGILFELKSDMLVTVATDGHELVCNKNIIMGNTVQASFILPKKPALFLKGILGNSDAKVAIKFDNKTAQFSLPEGVFECRLIEGTYPNYSAVIPQQNPYRVTVDRISLQNALKRIIPFADEQSHLVKLSINENMIVLEGNDFNYDRSAREQVACNYSGMPINIGFNSQGMYEMVQNMYGEEIAIELADPSKPGIVTPVEQPENQEVLMLIMPMMLNN